LAGLIRVLVVILLEANGCRPVSSLGENPDTRRPAIVARAFSYNAGGVSPLVRCGSDSVDRSLYIAARI